MSQFGIGKIGLELLNQLDAFARIVEDFEVEPGLHQENLRYIIRLFALMLGQQLIQRIEFVRQVGFGLFALIDLGLDLFDNDVEVRAYTRRFCSWHRTRRQEQAQRGEREKNFRFHQ